MPLNLLSQNEQLDILFKKWREIDVSYERNFRFDGIINEEVYNNSKSKLLFICKEPNGKNHKEKLTGDFRNEWNEKGAEYPFAYRIAEWSHGIHNDFPPLDEIYNLKVWEPPYKNALSAIAFMNLKKSAGGGDSELSSMRLSVKQERQLILEQIKIIDPQIIILGLSWEELRNELIDIPKNEWKESGYQIAICKWNKAKVIDFYHPSSRTPPSAAYSLLQNVVRSKEFQQI